MWSLEFWLSNNNKKKLLICLIWSQFDYSHVKNPNTVHCGLRILKRQLKNLNFIFGLSCNMQKKPVDMHFAVVQFTAFPATEIWMAFVFPKNTSLSQSFWVCSPWTEITRKDSSESFSRDFPFFLPRIERSTVTPSYT